MVNLFSRPTALVRLLDFLIRCKFVDTIAAELESIIYLARILEQVTINRRLLIGRDDHLDQSEAYDLS